MDPITRQGISVAAGAGGAEATYVDDVFSTFLYEGTGSSRSINNGIDLSGEGGLVWIKRRTFPSNTIGRHNFYDTERGATKAIFSNDNDVENTRSGALTAFNSNGFTLGNFTDENGSGNDICSWTFRKAPGFFDVVTYTGNGSVRTISHNLGSVPGMIICKRLDASSQWPVWHRSVSLNTTAKLQLEESSAAANSANMFTATAPTSTEFTIGTHSNINTNGGTYVAYLFAHDDQSFGTDSDESIVKCGSYTGNGSTTGPVIDLGFEPQWLLVKLSSTSGGYWVMLDNMRGVNADGQTSILYANDSGQEVTSTFASFSSTGFQPRTGSNYMNSSGQTYIYMAIRRPHKPPTAGTDVFGIDNGSSSSTIPNWDSGFPVDMSFFFSTFGGYNFGNAARILGSKWFKTDLPDALAADGSMVWDSNEGYGTGYQSHWYSHMFKRAPGFFDVVAYTGTGSSRNLSHNLGAVPELIIQKRRSTNGEWHVFANSVTSPNSDWYLNFGNLNRTYSLENNFGNTGISGDPTSTVIPLGNSSNLNGSSSTFVMYLFASLNGISKVGSYTGTGYSVNVDCGFAAGARFVLIKRTDSSGDWYVWDTLRGIVSGNDPYKLLNSNAAQVTNTDYIDPLNAGFTVTSSAPAALNASGGTYLFLAIA